MRTRKGMTWKQFRNMVEQELRNNKIPEEQEVYIEEINVGWCDVDLSIGMSLSDDDSGKKQIAIWGN